MATWKPWNTVRLEPDVTVRRVRRLRDENTSRIVLCMELIQERELSTRKNVIVTVTDRMLLVGTLTKPPRTRHEYWIAMAGGGEQLPTSDNLRSTGWTYQRNREALDDHWDKFRKGERTFWGGAFVLMIKKSTGNFSLLSAYSDFDAALLAARVKMRSRARYNRNLELTLPVDLKDKGISAAESTIATVIADLLDRSEKVRKRGDIGQINETIDEITEATDAMELLLTKQKQLETKRQRMFSV